MLQIFALNFLECEIMCHTFDNFMICVTSFLLIKEYLFTLYLPTMINRVIFVRGQEGREHRSVI